MRNVVWTILQSSNSFMMIKNVYAHSNEWHFPCLFYRDEDPIILSQKHLMNTFGVLATGGEDVFDIEYADKNIKAVLWTRWGEYPQILRSEISAYEFFSVREMFERSQEMADPVVDSLPLIAFHLRH